MRVRNTLVTLNTNEISGPTGSLLYKKCAAELPPVLMNLFQSLVTLERFPVVGKMHEFSPILEGAQETDIQLS